jgi:hypothetical protein
VKAFLRRRQLGQPSEHGLPHRTAFPVGESRKKPVVLVRDRQKAGHDRLPRERAANAIMAVHLIQALGSWKDCPPVPLLFRFVHGTYLRQKMAPLSPPVTILDGHRGQSLGLGLLNDLGRATEGLPGPGAFWVDAASTSTCGSICSICCSLVCIARIHPSIRLHRPPRIGPLAATDRLAAPSLALCGISGESHRCLSHERGALRQVPLCARCRFAPGAALRQVPLGQNCHTHD